MSNRNDEKIGWTAGWSGGFIWTAILAAVFLFQGKLIHGLSGIILTLSAFALIIYFSPWKHPETPYWKLMLAPYSIFFVSVAWAIWAYGGLRASGIDWWAIFWFIPILIPLGNMANRKWSDGDNAIPDKGSKILKQKNS
jgi:hypothetical protein